jgi:hypothetical protein
MAAASPPADMPDMKKGGMTSSEKGAGMLHNLHFGEMVLNHPTTKALLKALGIGLKMARDMKPEDLMKKVKEMIAKLPSREEGGMADIPPRVSPAKSAPARKKGGMSQAGPGRVNPAEGAPARKKGGMADTPARANPAKGAPSRKKGGMSAVYETKDRMLGRVPGHDQI